MALTQTVYRAAMGNTGEYIISIAVFVFAVATVLCQYYYGAESLGYLTSRKIASAIYTIVFFAAIFYGSVAKSDGIWRVTDLTVGIMTIINCGVLLCLNKEIVCETEGYFLKNRTKKEAVVMTASRVSISKNANS